MKKLFIIQLLILTLALAACDQRRQGGQTGNTSPTPMSTSSPIPGPQGSVAGTSNAGEIGEGTINGGGGRGVICKADGKETLEVLDLYEAHASYGLTVIKNPATEDAAMSFALDALAKHFWNPDTISIEKLKESYLGVIKREWTDKIKFIEPGKKLKRVNDSHEVISDSNCQSVQIAVYLEGSILIDKELWDRLDNLNKTALILHELIYFVERQENAMTNSISTRLLVGQLFSTKGSRGRSEGVPKDLSKIAVCSYSDENEKSIGYGYAWDAEQDGQTGVEFTFNYLAGYSSSLRMSMFMPGLERDHLLEGKTKSWYSGKLRTESLAKENFVALAIDGLSGKMTVESGSQKSNFQMKCNSFREDPPKPIAPPTPSSFDGKDIEFISAENGGSYEATAAYSFRKQTHDVNLTRNNWDLLFIGFKDRDYDVFESRMVTDDQSHVIPLSSGQNGCDGVTICDQQAIIRMIQDPRFASGTEMSRYQVVVKQCYLLVVKDTEGSLNVMFEVAENKRGVSAKINKIKPVDFQNLMSQTCESKK